MEDIDKARMAGGTVADFSGWNMENKFGTMNITTKEKVIEPEVEKPKPENIERKEASQQQKRELPNSPKELTVNPNELKNIAIKLLPDVSKITDGDYESICDKAIEMAFAFESVWQKKIQIGE